VDIADISKTTCPRLLANDFLANFKRPPQAELESRFREFHLTCEIVR